MTHPIAPSQLWWTAQEIADAALPDLPATRQGVEAVIARHGWRSVAGMARRRAGRGGGWEYSWQMLPDRAKRRLLQAAAAEKAGPVALPVRRDRDEAWNWYEALPKDVKDKALLRLQIVQQVEALEIAQGRGRHQAVQDVARISGAGARTIWSWFALIEGVRADDRLPFLCPRNRAQADRPREKEFSPEFFEVLRADFLRLGEPPFSDCYRRAVRIAKAKGWDVLCERTMRRVMDRRVSKLLQVLARKGVEALKRLYPPQVRDKAALVPLEAVNADFHKFDVFVSWPVPRGEKPMILRPQMVAFQDIYSGRILSWRLDVSANSTAVLLAAGDMIETWGIPQHVLLDNGREFAAKPITGGAATRYRFKVKDDDIPGLFTGLNCQIHFASPYHGQAKPIERAFRDMAKSIALDPRLAGAYTGNRPDAKPEDYGSRAVPLADFVRVLAEGIEEHNTRDGRRSEVAFGRSFAAVFDEAYATAPITKATEAQRRYWLLGAEGVRADAKSGAIWFQENEFWADWLHAYAGKRLIVRFDPAAFHDGLHVYSADDAYLGHAPVRQASGFFDADEARMLARAKSAWLKAEKAALAAHRTLTAAQLGRMLDEVAPHEPEPVAAKVVKPVFGRAGRPGGTAPDARVVQAQVALVADFAAHRAGQAGPEPIAVEDPREMFRRALDLERALEAGTAVTDAQRAWLASVQTTSAYRGQRMLWDQMGDQIFG